MQFWHEGKQLQNGKLIVEKVLGNGGYGVTYKVRETSTGRYLAVKKLKEERRKQANFQEQQTKFFNEIIALANCTHPNIVRVYPRTFMDSGLLCMVMEYIEGVDLAEYIDTNGKFSEPEAIALITKVGRALAHIHQQGLLHRDIKPDNILLRQADLEPVLIDFGLAREYTPGTIKSMTDSKTIGYAPIEQYQRRGNFGAWTDVYALAATLYSMVTGRAPIPADARQDSPSDLLVAPQYFNPDLSDKLQEAILRGMAIKISDRPRTVQRWLDTLSHKQNPVYLDDFTVSLQIFEFETVQINKIKVNSFLGLSKDKKVILDKAKKQVNYFIEKLNNSIDLEMVYIPTESFLMGTDPEEITKLNQKYNTNYFNQEQQSDKEKLPEFYLGKFPITQAQYRAIMSDNPSCFQGNNLPVERVSWNNAVEFCQKLSEKTGKEYRLPSEHEWEYACRAGTKTPFYFGQTLTTDLANYNGIFNYANEPKGKHRERTTPVDSFLPNAFGLHDMHGNVWEWCSDDVEDNHQHRTNTMTVEDSSYKIARGGSWYSDPVCCRSTYRQHISKEYRGNDIGFRVVCVSPNIF